MADGAPGERFPGVLDLTGSLSRADGTRVHRYLPLAIDRESRHSVRDAVVAGSASSVQFRVRGDLHDLPFNDPKQGEFRIAARVKDVTYAYVPTALQPAGTRPWPALTGLAGELVFERSSMLVRGAGRAEKLIALAWGDVSTSPPKSAWPRRPGSGRRCR